MANLTTLSGAQRELEKLKQQQVRRIGVKTLATWAAVIEWFSGNQDPKLREKLMWEPGRTFGKLLPLPMEERPAFWPKLFGEIVGRLILGVLDGGMAKEKLKSKHYLDEVLRSVAHVMRETEWGPILEEDQGAMDGTHFYRIRHSDNRKEDYTTYPDGRVIKEGEWNPSIQNWDRTEVTQEELEAKLNECMQ